MKKITFIIALFSFTLSAQNFPSPYCNISDIEDVEIEEITSVNFSGIVINNTDNTAALINKTIISVDVVQNQVYTIQVFGDTKGNFDNAIVAFVDWNDNGILDDAGEVYEIGILTNSDGYDAVSVSMDITVPLTAVVGPKRIRLTKIYTDEESQSFIDPCAISFTPFGFGPYPGYGQALDFTLNVGTLSAPGFDEKSLVIYPIPAKDNLTLSYKSAIESLTIYNLVGQEVFSDNNLESTVNVDISTFSSGTYIAKISSESTTHTVKIIKD